jgi:hypothetical protein
MTATDTGKIGAKFSNRDDLLTLMRTIVAEGRSREEAIGLCYKKILENEVLTSDAVRYTCANLYERCVVRRNTAQNQQKQIETKAIITEGRIKAREVIESSIRLWTWKVPGTGKILSECTFGELPDVAPLIGRFLSKLSQQGAPGTLIKEVFTSEEDLQSFWRSSQ